MKSESVILLTILLASCSNKSNKIGLEHILAVLLLQQNESGKELPKYSILIQANGLDGTLKVKNNSNIVSITQNDQKKELSKLTSGTEYKIKILEQPAYQTCTTSHSSGKVYENMEVLITCSYNSYTLSGNLSGLNTGRFVKLYNGSETLTLGSNENFAFAKPLAYNANYSVSVLENPIGQECSIANGTGKVTGNISNLSVTCAEKMYTISGYITGALSSVSVVNSITSEAVSGTYSYGFSTKVKYGDVYNLSVSPSNVDNICTVNQPIGTVTSDVIKNVICTTCYNKFVHLFTNENSTKDNDLNIVCSVQGISITAVKTNPYSYVYYYPNFVGRGGKGTSTSYLTVKPTATVKLSDMGLTTNNIHLETTTSSGSCYSDAYIYFLNSGMGTMGILDLGCNQKKIFDTTIPVGTYYLHLTSGDYGASVLIGERK